MHVKLSIQERLKDLRVVNKDLTLEKLAEQTGFPNRLWGNMKTMIIRTSAPLPLQHWQNFTACPPTT